MSDALERDSATPHHDVERRAGRDEAAAANRVFAVVLCWNDADRVLAMLARLGTLSPGPDAVVVVDNGSAGGDADRVEAAFPGASLIRLDRNRGFAGGVNRGIEAALDGGATHVWLLNTDLHLPDTVLGDLLEVVSADPRCAMSAPVLVETDGEVQAWGGGAVDLATGVSRHVLVPGEKLDYLTAACLLVRARVFEEIGLLDEGYFFYWEDTDLGFRTREAGWSLGVADGCRVVHEEGSSLGRWSGSRWERLFEGQVRFLRGRAPRPRLALAIRLLHHSAAMAVHGRWAALAGAWRGAVRGLRA